MKRSTDRILTTHTGSLPRPDKLVELMYAKEEGKAVDARLLAERVSESVREVVRRQVEVGIDVVSDGEMSKPSYATYVTERLTGFGGTSNRPKLSDLLDYPNVASNYFNDPGVQRLNMNRPACNGPVKTRGTADAAADIENFKGALKGAKVADSFMTAASPGVVSMFLGNTYYKTEEEFLWAVAEAMKPEYEAIIAAGFNLQLDCPDLAMTRHREFADQPVEPFRDYVRLHIEVLNAAVANLPPERVRVHLCWGNYPGPHHRDVPLAEIIDLILTIKPHGLLFEAANSRHAHEWKVFEGLEDPGRQGADPRRHRVDVEPDRAPGARRANASCASRTSSAARTSSPAATAASARSSDSRSSSPRSPGPSSPRCRKGARIASDRLW